MAGGCLLLLCLVVRGVAWTRAAEDLVTSNSTSDGSVERRSVYELLSSIERKLKPLDALDGVTVVNWLQGNMLERLARRLDAVENKLEHLENRLDAGMDKMEQMLSRSTCGESCEKAEKALDKTGDKMLSNLDLMEAKIGLRLDAWSSKLDRLELKLESDVNNVFSRFVQLETMVDKMDTPTYLDNRLRQISEAQQAMHQDIKKMAPKNHSQVDIEATKCPWTHAMAADDTTSASNQDWSNVTSTLNELVVVGAKKFQELDHDIEIYTRKVVNAYQELLKESKEVKDQLNKVMDHDNQTKILVRDGFRKLFQQMKPLSSVEETMLALQKKVGEMEGTVDSSFASLLVAQNTFIASCHRIQQQEPMIETKIYHLLLKHIKDLEERWSSLGNVNTNTSTVINANGSLEMSLESHRKEVGRALHDLVWTVISVGNQTVDEVRHLLRRHNATQPLA